jgi:hypothetical protein
MNSNFSLLKNGAISSIITASFYSKAISLLDFEHFALSLKLAGVASGTFSLQVSNENNDPGSSPSESSWSTLTGSEYIIDSDLGVDYSYSNIPYRWIRIAYVHTSGTLTINNADVVLKGDN